MNRPLEGENPLCQAESGAPGSREYRCEYRRTKEEAVIDTTDPIERAKAHAATMYPSALIKTRNHRGRPVVLAVEDNLIRIVRLDAPDAQRSGKRSRQRR